MKTEVGKIEEFLEFENTIIVVTEVIVNNIIIKTVTLYVYSL